MTLGKQIDIIMKTGISKLFVASIAALLLGVLPVFAGGEFETKKYKISDFRHRTTYVVLSGNAIVDAVLRSEFQRVWTLSPYEFSTIEDFNVSKKNPESYFLLLVDSRFRNERHDNGIMDLSLFKGDPAATGEGVEGLYHVANLLANSGHKISVKAYSGYRHEIHNELDLRDEVEAGLIKFMDDILA